MFNISKKTKENIMNDAISVFGSQGFVGSWFWLASKFHTQDIPREDTVAKSSRILYLRGTVHNYNVFDNPTLDIDTNLRLFIETLDWNRRNSDLQEVNFVSSWFVYGRQDVMPVKEDAYCDPKGFYSITKRCAEQLLISYCETYNITWRILRLANVMGIGDKKISRKKNAVQYMIKELAKGNKVDYLYKNHHTRDFIDVRDVVTAFDCILERGEPNQIYNVGSGEGYDVNDVIIYAAKKLHQEDNLAYIDAPAFHKQVQGQHMRLSIAKLRSLGYKPRYDILETIDWLIDYYQHE
jgi:nucleoside-diphosphate-sugar epimerase